MSDQLEMYYAEMEAARNAAEDAYFDARPQLSHDVMQQVLFRRGFEMGFKYLWDKRSAETQHAPVGSVPRPDSAKIGSRRAELPDDSPDDSGDEHA